MDCAPSPKPDAAPTSAPRQPALSHLRVLDLSRVLAGPLAAQVLGDLGAEVIKIERPEGGDDTRSWGPPWWPGDSSDAGEAQAEVQGGGPQDGEPAAPRVASYFLCANRNKQSVAIDLACADGQALVRELAQHCDVVIENFKVGGLAHYGLDHASLRAANPRLVVCSITGFGQTGPYAQRAGYDFLMQGLGGLMSVSGRPDVQPGGGPMKVGVALTDVMTGLYAVIAIQAALAERERSGLGQHIDLALLDVQVAGLANQALNFLTTGRAPQRLGNAHPSIVPYQDFPTADGNMVIAVGNDTQFARLAAALGQAAWAGDARFSSGAARVKHRATLVPLIAELTRAQTTAHWVAALERIGVPCGPINDVAQVFDDPQVQSRGLRVELPGAVSETGVGRPVPSVASPIRLSETPVRYERAPPQLGEHTREVLTRVLGLGAERLDRLVDTGVIR